MKVATYPLEVLVRLRPSSDFELKLVTILLVSRVSLARSLAPVALNFDRERRRDPELSVDRGVVPDGIEVAVRYRCATWDGGHAGDQTGDLAYVLISRRRNEQRVAVDEIASVRGVRRNPKSKRATADGERRTARLRNTHGPLRF
jgi:hypothetical protein